MGVNSKVSDKHLKALAQHVTISLEQDSSDLMPEMRDKSPKMRAMYGEVNYFGTLGYDGEKNRGEVGPIKEYWMDYNALRMRSWQAFIESDIAAPVVKRFVQWVIGPGLKLQAEPNMEVLKDYGMKFDREKMSRKVEARFRQFCSSRMSDYADMQNLDMMEAEAYKNAKVAGDVLVVLRYDKTDRCVKVQLIDGAHVQNPPSLAGGTELFPIKLENGNTIIHGVEVNGKGQHVAYHVRKPNAAGVFGFEFIRIPARGPRSSELMAYMVYGAKYRVDSHRGMPMLYCVLETIKKLERYKEAAVGSAEERQKIAYFFEHGLGSDGSFPLSKVTAIAREFESVDGSTNRFVPIDDLGNQLADRVAVSTNKKVFNLPQDSSVKSVAEPADGNFETFYKANLQTTSAALDIPYEILLQVFGSNYSASRGAWKQWEHNINVERYFFAFQFMQPIYDFWFETEVLTRRIELASYLRAIMFIEDRYAIEAHRKARFIGPNVPHIDPEKEVKAERLKLGTAMDAVPLTTVENATEVLNGGDSEANMEQASGELKRSKSLGLKVEVPPTQAGKPGAKPAKKKKAA